MTKHFLKHINLLAIAVLPLAASCSGAAEPSVVKPDSLVEEVEEEPPTSTLQPTKTATSTATATPIPMPRVSVRSIFLHSGPDEAFRPPVVEVVEGDELEVIAANEDSSWYIVRLPSGVVGLYATMPQISPRNQAAYAHH